MKDVFLFVSFVIVAFCLFLYHQDMIVFLSAELIESEEPPESTLAILISDDSGRSNTDEFELPLKAIERMMREDKKHESLDHLTLVIGMRRKCVERLHKVKNTRELLELVQAYSEIRKWKVAPYPAKQAIY